MYVGLFCGRRCFVSYVSKRPPSSTADHHTVGHRALQVEVKKEPPASKRGGNGNSNRAFDTEGVDEGGGGVVLVVVVVVAMMLMAVAVYYLVRCAPAEIKT